MLFPFRTWHPGTQRKPWPRKVIVLFLFLQITFLFDEKGHEKFICDPGSHDNIENIPIVTESRRRHGH